MSNSAVGNVYQAIIDDVINSSRVDFEENGVEENVLEELRRGWQQKLSQLDVAQFPWDPKPDPTPAPQPASQPVALAPQQSPQVPQYSPPISMPGLGTSGALGQNGIKQEDGIKQEPGTQGIPALPSYNGLDDKNSVAASRAAQQLQLQYGNRAAGSINAIQDRVHQQQQQSGGDASHSLSNGQTDGAGDAADEFEGVLLRRNATGSVDELGRVEIDRMLHDQIAARAKSMEGGGLMLPLAEASKHTSRGRSSRQRGPSRYDGGDDEDEDDVEDEDAINSDLDDPEEDQDEDEVDDEGLGHIMLCMYDKVQRVKNKWKCTLKDGVLTVNGKEYVFHKATGEYEW